MDITFFIANFNFIGAIVAFTLAILKINEYLKDKPCLKITPLNIFYDYYDKKTRFLGGFRIINNGTRPIKIICFSVDILDENKNQLNIHSNCYKINTRLLSQDHLEKSFEYNVYKKLPQKKYKIKTKIETTYKTYTRVDEIPLFNDFSGPIYKEITAGLKKGKFE